MHTSRDLSLRTLRYACSLPAAVVNTALLDLGMASNAFFSLSTVQVMRSIKTQLTAHTVLMHKKRFVHGIMSSGLVDDKEGNEMADMVNIKVKDMVFKPLRPKISKPEVISLETQ